MAGRGRAGRSVGAARVDAQVRDALAAIVEDDLADPRLSFVTITGVEVTPDHRYATVWWSALDPDVVARDPGRTRGDRVPSAAEVEAGLAAAAPRMQGLLAGRLRLRNTPELRLRRDPARATGERVEALLRDLQAGGGP